MAHAGLLLQVIRKRRLMEPGSSKLAELAPKKLGPVEIVRKWSVKAGESLRYRRVGAVVQGHSS